jgi:hypothetical protein
VSSPGLSPSPPSCDWAHLDGRTRGSVEKDDLAAAPVVGVAPDRPEVASLELARALAARLDGGLVHRLDPAGADGCELCRDDGGQQQCHGQDLLGEPLAADLYPGGQQTLVLAIQRQVVEKFVDDQAGEEADIGAPALQHARRGGGTGQGRGVLDLDDRSHVLEYHIAARALGEAVGDLLGNDLVGLGGQPGDRGVGHIDGLYRHPLGIEEQRRLRALAFGLGRAAALVGGDRLGRQRSRRRGAQPLAQGHLLGWGLDVAPLGLLAEELALKPGDLAFKIGDTCHQQGALGGPFGRGCDSGQGRRHGRILPCLRWCRTQSIPQPSAHRLDAFQ